MNASTRWAIPLPRDPLFTGLAALLDTMRQAHHCWSEQWKRCAIAQPDVSWREHRWDGISLPKEYVYHMMERGMA